MNDDRIDSIGNPFVLPDLASIDAATQRLNGACEAWGHDTAGMATRSRAKRLLKRTRMTRYIVLTQDPLRSRLRDYVTFSEAVSMVGTTALVDAVANGTVPIVIAEGADFTFRRGDLKGLRQTFGPDDWAMLARAQEQAREQARLQAEQEAANGKQAATTAQAPRQATTVAKSGNLSKTAKPEKTARKKAKASTKAAARR
ncbi:hypothetical protein [Paraburkholderia sp. C35]|uniref:hypothetical protein n=1 Tax=Paraburkholderia sp. C35 TaxID=2126993 RepID=UPI000D695CEA|nr:hypothetical protein [Paraburkholderia sp. C35]